MRWYAYHACLCHPLASCASLHACLHVHAWNLLASVLSMLQHNEAMDIQSKPTFVPRGHHLLFVFLLVAFLLVCLLYCFSDCHAYHTYLLYTFSYALCISSFHCLSIGFVSLPLHVHMYGARMLGARAQSPKCKQKRHRCKHMVKPSGSVQ